MVGNVLLLSIHPEYANKIFNGTKKVELRKTRPRINKGDLVLVYGTSPLKALMGAFEVVRVVEALPQELWSDVQHIAGITHEQFENYYAGASSGFGIHFNKTCCLPEPFTLTRLRHIWSDFQPPQSYRYLTLDELSVLGRKIRGICEIFYSKIEGVVELPDDFENLYDVISPPPCTYTPYSSI